jgi:acyl-CoA synthetase (AMP-forming)/AMP-acid ligase II
MMEFPASYAQERMWFFHRLDPSNPSYNVPLLLRLRGRLDVARLERALAGVAGRHEILRTTFTDEGGSLRQRVHDSLAVPFDQVAAASSAAGGLVREFVRAPFDLTAGPPLRARLVRFGPDDHLLMLCQHHIATDGWSLGVLVRELDALYRDAPLPEPPIQYADYAEWERATLTPEALEAELGHWHSHLGPNPPRLTLPTDRPRPDEPSFRGARADFAVSPETSGALREVARRHGATLYMTLLAAWSTLLHRYGGGSEVIVGTLLANRDNDQVASLIGLFVNTLPLRVDLSGDPSFTDLLARVRTATLDVLAHQDTPTEKIIDRVRPGREGGGNPLFQVLFALQNFADQRLRLGDLDVERVVEEEESTRFDLELHVWEHPGRLSGALVYDTDLFDDATAERMVNHLHALLEGAIADPGAPVSALPLRSAEEERRLRDGRLVVLDDHDRVPPEGVSGDVWEAGTRTGERGRVRPGGTVEVFPETGPDGRLPDVIRAAGRRLRRADLEEALLRADPTLADAVVVPRVRHDTGAREPIAYVVPTGPIDPDKLAAALPVPAAVVPISALPLTAAGEPDTWTLLRLPVADTTECGRLEQRLTGHATALVTETEPAPPPRAPVPIGPAAPTPGPAQGPDETGAARPADAAKTPIPAPAEGPGETGAAGPTDELNTARAAGTAGKPVERPAIAEGLGSAEGPGETGMAGPAGEPVARSAVGDGVGSAGGRGGIGAAVPAGGSDTIRAAKGLGSAEGPDETGAAVPAGGSDTTLAAEAAGEPPGPSRVGRPALADDPGGPGETGTAEPAGGDAAGERPAIADGGPAVDAGIGCLGDALIRAAETAPEGRADIVVISDDDTERSLTYRELLDRSRRALAGLRDLGLTPGDPVLLQLDDHADFMTVLWAAVLGGYVAVPLATPGDYRHRDAALDRFHGAWDLLDRPLVVTAPSRLDEIRAAAREHGWDALRVTCPGELAAGSASPDHPARPDDPVLYLLTSGSTGRPKAVVLRHRNILARSVATAARNGLGPDDVSFNWMPLDHVGGVVMFHLRDVILGSRQVHAPTRWVLRDPLRWLDCAHRHRATATWAPNFAFGLVADHAPGPGRDWDLSRLRLVMNAGEAIVSRVARRWLRLLAPYGLPGTAMRPAWGMSETSSAMTYSDRFTLDATSDDDVFVEVGPPLPGCTVRIVGGDDTVLHEGRIGRLQVRGTTVTSGYHNAEERNTFTADGWFDTGDLGRLDDGRLTLTGRAKDVIIVNGVNHHSHEIESAVEELDCVEPSYTAAVAVRPPGATTDELAVFVHLRPATGALQQVRQAVLNRVGVNPRHVIPVERADIPKTEIGKIQRSLLRSRFEAGVYATIAHRPAWIRRYLPPAPAPKKEDVLLVLDDHGLGERLAELLGTAGRRCVRVSVPADGTEFAHLAPDHYAVAPGSAAGYRRLGEALTEFPETVVHLRACGPVPDTPEKARAELHDLLHLTQLATPATTLYAVTQTIEAYERAPLTGLIASLAHERPHTRVVHLDLDDTTPAEFDDTTSADVIAAELTLLPRERVVAHRSGRRLVRRLLPAGPANGHEPIRRGGRYLVTGAGGGIGRLLVRELTGTYGARVLALGRTAPPGEPECVAADVRDPEALARVLGDAERRWGAPLDGVFHLAGHYDERPLDRCTPADLDEVLAAKVEGARNLHALLRDRPGTLFVSFSSVNGLLGGPGAYAAANAYLDALAVHQRDHGLNAYSLAWSMWDETGMSAGYPLKTLTAARGYRVLPPAEALRSLRVALAHDAPHQLIGLDPSRPWIASHLTDARPLRRLTLYTEGETIATAHDRYGTPLAQRTVRLDALPRDPESGAVDRARLAGTTSDETDEPRAGLESVIAATWAEVLGIERVGAEENFFDLGGGSLQATRAHGLLEERLGRELSMVELFRRPTVRSLAGALEPDAEPAAAGGRGRARAERRRRAAASRT